MRRRQGLYHALHALLFRFGVYSQKKQKQKQLKTRIEHAVQFIPCKGNISKSVYFHMLLSGNSI